MWNVFFWGGTNWESNCKKGTKVQPPRENQHKPRGNEECTMWNEIFQFLLMVCRWIMIGDLNMIESPLDGFMSSCSHLMGWKKELAWANVINKYNIDGYLSRNDGPIFS